MVPMSPLQVLAEVLSAVPSPMVARVPHDLGLRLQHGRAVHVGGGDERDLWARGSSPRPREAPRPPRTRRRCVSRLHRTLLVPAPHHHQEVADAGDTRTHEPRVVEEEHQRLPRQADPREPAPEERRRDRDPIRSSAARSGSGRAPGRGRRGAGACFQHPGRTRARRRWIEPARVPEQPLEDVSVRIGDQLPGHHAHADHAGRHAAHAERDVLRRRVPAKSFAGDTTFAAMFTLSVAMTTVNIADADDEPRLEVTDELDRSIGLPWMTSDALVMMTPHRGEHRHRGRQRGHRLIACSRCAAPVAREVRHVQGQRRQKPTIAVTLGTKTFQNSRQTGTCSPVMM